MASYPGAQLRNVFRTEIAKAPMVGRMSESRVSAPQFPPPPLTPLTSTSASHALPATQPVSMDALQHACKKYAVQSTSQVANCVRSVWTHGFPDDFSPAWMRAAILSKSIHFSTESVLEALEVFERSNAVDHLFFKELSKNLFGRIKDMSIMQICRMLRVYDSAGLGEYIVNEQLYLRLNSIVNRASIVQLVDILWSVSGSDTALMDRTKIAELCLNRYSLYLRSQSGECVDMDLKILGSMCRLKLVHEGTVRKIMRRVTRYHRDIESSSLYQVRVFFNSLGVYTGHLLGREGATFPADPSLVVSANCTAHGVTRLADVLRACCDKHSSPIVQLKQKIGLACLATLEPSSLGEHLNTLSLTELVYLNALMARSDGLVEKAPSALRDERWSLKAVNVYGGILRTAVLDIPIMKIRNKPPPRLVG